MASYPSQLGQGAFVQTTDVFDTSAIHSMDINSKEFKEFLVRLRQSINNIALSLNVRDAGYYVQTEFVNGQAYFPDPTLNSTTATAPVHRQVFRKVINFGALPSTATKTSAHGITVTDAFTFTRIYATATDTTGHDYIPIPYASATAIDVVELSVDGTNVSITTGKDQTAFDTCYVVLEYIKQ